MGFVFKNLKLTIIDKKERQIFENFEVPIVIRNKVIT